MPSTPEETRKSLNAIAARLPLLDKSDLAPLCAVMEKLEALKRDHGLRPAFGTLIDRAVSLVQNIIMAETPFDAGCKKLGECVAKMLKEAEKTGKEDGKEESGDGKPVTRNPESVIRDPEPGTRNPERSIPDDLRDLVSKFAANQQAVLEDFEESVLAFEKGDEAAKSAIKRILHTWKGEFGVLDMQEYARLVHETEDRLENGRLAGENLFRLKDFLQERMHKFAAGRCPAVSETEKVALLGEAAPAAAAADKPPSGGASPDGGPDSGNQQSALVKTPDRPFQGDASLLADFINESRDHIHTAETMLLELETDPSNSERVDAVFRAWHTIKGVAGFLSLREVQELAHAMESVMDKARKHEILLNAQSIDVLLEGNDCLKQFLGLVEEAMSSGTLRIPDNYDGLMLRLKSCHLQTGRHPDAGAAATGKKLGEILVERGAAPAEAVTAAIERQKLGDDRKLGEILVQDQNVPARAVGGALAAQGAARGAHAIEENIRVPVGRIDQLVDTIGEAVIAQSMIYAHQSIRSIDDQSVHTKFAHAAMIMRQIQEMAMSLRMVSVKATFQKMARLARDLAKKFNREVDFLTEGEDTELDKSVVENIGDPLIHMIRNSIDHGVEPPEERLKAGKPAKAVVKLKAYHRAGNIYIEVVDDGRGLDREAILKKAQSKELCKADERLSDEEIFRFIFLPGFSTAKVVTDVSGRGVGMDVVRRNIEALRGSCEISSVWGKGTTFTIRLPLTLAIVDGMIVRAGAENYIIPTLAIIESLRPQENQIEKVLGKGKLINVRGDLIPLVNLESLFGKNGGAMGNGNGGLDGVVMIVEDMLGKRIGLYLSEIVGQQQVVIKSLGQGMGDVPGVTGGAIMSDGSVSLILDIGGIVKMAQG